MSTLQEDTVAQLIPRGRISKLYPGMGPLLSQLCSAADNLEVVHSSGHRVTLEEQGLEGLLAAAAATLTRVSKGK
jgi:hypothetical protein